MSEGLNVSQTSLTLPVLKDTWQVKARSILKFLCPAFHSKCCLRRPRQLRYKY